MKKTLRKILIFLCLAVFLFSAAQVYQILRGYNQASSQYSALEQYVVIESPAPEPPPSPESVQTEPEPEAPALPAVDFDALSQINPDIVGWLIVEGTEINYPVVQGHDNDYYLNHQFDRSYNSAGCLFLDVENDPVFHDSNSIVYGHYMKNGTMFSAITKYKEETFYNAHPTALLITPDATYTIRFFSGYVSATDSSAWNRNFSAEEYALWLDTLTAKSCFSSDTVPLAQDGVITLSTCSYEFQNARFVLHGVMTAADS